MAVTELTVVLPCLNEAQTDDRGSITDAFRPDGTATWANNYDPRGGVLAQTPLVGNAVQNHFGYTGAYREPATGDLALRARDYSPAFGRFTATDPAVVAPHAQSASPYVYVSNRPTVLTDPTGLCPWCFVGAAVGAVAGGVTYALTTDDFSVGGLAKASGVGAVAGGVAVLTFGGSLAVTGTAGYGISTVGGVATASFASGAAGTVTASLLAGQGLPSAGETLAGGALGVAGAGIGAGIARAVAPRLSPAVSDFIKRLCGRRSPTGDINGAPPRPITTGAGTIIDRTAVSSSVSAQRQGRHVLGARQYNGGSYFKSADDAQRVLDDYRSGAAQVLGTKGDDVVVRVQRVTGFNHNPGAGFPNQPTNVFFIKGSASPSVVPYNPAWKP